MNRKNIKIMEENATKLLNKLAGYKTRIKELHWDASNISSHELCDKVTDGLYSFEDSIAEELQTLFGKIKPGEIQQELPKATTLKEFLAELLSDIYTYYGTISDAKYVGLRSVIEGFIHDVNVYDYLADMAINEAKKNGNKEVMVKESTLKRVIGNKYSNMLKEAFEGIQISGNYDLENGSVFIDEEQSFISVKSKDGHELFKKQGDTVKNLLEAFKAHKPDDESFKQFLNNWLADIQK